MNVIESALEVRETQAIEIPQCEVVLPMPRAWFDAINAGHAANPAIIIPAAVADGDLFISEPKTRKDFPRVWREVWKPYVRKIPRRGEMVRALIPMRKAVFECLQSAAESVGSSAHEVALAIIARSLEPRSNRRDYATAPAPEIYLRPPTSPQIEGPPANIFTFHKCRACPHRWRPWHSPQPAS